MTDTVLGCYTRVSTTEQKRGGNSLEVQKDLGKKVSKKLGLKFRHYDEGSRSSTIHYRDVLEELKDDILRGKIKNIWVQDRSRLFRESVDGLLFRRDFLERFNVTLWEGETPTRLDMESEDDKLLYDIITRVQENENKKRSLKSKRGKLFKLEKHSPFKSVYMGGTILFGYTVKDKVWKIHREESKWVKWIFQSYEDGLSTKEIKDYLDKEGVQPRRTGNGLWNLGTLQKMLDNKSYTGIHTVRQWENCHYEDYEKNRERNPDDYKKVGRFFKRSVRTFSYKVPKIISVGQFNRVQKRMGNNLKNKSNHKQHFSVLEDLLVCECGRRLGSLVRSGKTKSSLGYTVTTRKYYCVSGEYDWKSGDPKNCMNVKSLNMDVTNDYVLDFVKDVVRDSNILKEKYKTEVLSQKDTKLKDVKEEEKKLESKCQRLQNSIDRIENNIVELEVDLGLGKKDKSLVDKIIQRFYQELESTKSEYEKTEKEIEDLGQEVKWLDWLGGYGDQIKLNTSTEKKQREFLLGVLDKVVVKSEYGYGRDKSKEVQVGHSLDFHFNLKVVGDGYRVLDKNTKPRTYEVVEGKKKTSSPVMRFVTPRTKKKTVK